MYDVLIIGAGIIGCAAARELSKYKLEILVLESESDVAMGSTAANSAIIHGGYDAKEDTLMAKLNVQGNELYDTWKRELNIPFKRIGSFVLAFNDEDEMELQSLHDRGAYNKVPGIEIISGDKAREMEPNLSNDVTAALYSPTAGITGPFETAIALIENAVSNGVNLTLNKRVTAIEKTDDVFIVSSDDEKFKARYVINAAGVYADDISRMAGDDSYNIMPRKGEYRLYDRKVGDMADVVIFQPPSKMGKGVLVTPTVDGNLIVGPNAIDTDDKKDTNTTSDGVYEVWKKSLKSIPTIPNRSVIRVFAGLRAVADVNDFVIGMSCIHGFINAAGMCSPGLSAAPAIAEMLADILKDAEDGLEINQDFNPINKSIPSFRKADWEERKALIANDPLYGRIVCRCETVTEAEIVAALKRSVPADTLDALKRRVRVGAGRCQGGFCTPRVMEIMCRELEVDMENITKKGEGSQLVRGILKGRLSHA